ncbi:multicopper oxidase family protein [Agromyces sp. SYSU T00266]|uniref:multicopper oxidase family protein n=1 Tax=Agromyces zhanjiangensis TaxID=3158562 RepID=UPI0033999398
MAASSRRNRWLRRIALLAILIAIAPLAWSWWASLRADTVSAMEMGYPDPGGGPPLAEGHHDTGASVTTLAEGTTREPDVEVTLVARAETYALPSGRRIDAYTLNGTTPGPTIRMRVGELLQVTLVNESVPRGATLHWHGIDVPNAADGVAGITQDAVRPGESYTYRFISHQAGTFWYHSHQVSHEQVRRGLFGAIIIEPAAPDTTPDVIAIAHIYNGVRTVNGHDGDAVVPVDGASSVRARVVNTDSGPLTIWTGAPYQILAIDGNEINGPMAIDGEALVLAAGGRADLSITPTAGGVRVHLGGPFGLVLGDRAPAAVRVPVGRVDLLGYGTPAAVDPALLAAPDREFRYIIDRRLAYSDGRPGMWWTINGGIYPDVPIFVVSEGDLVRVTIENRSSEVHPMHLHGHHVLVLSRNGVPAHGAPWWTDSLDVQPGEAYEVVFTADNPGIWMDHCHNLQHAADGLITHLMYTGVRTPFLLGGGHGNEPE